MNNFKIKILMLALVTFGFNSHAMATMNDHYIAAVIPFQPTPQATNSTNSATTQATPQTPTTNPSVSNQTQVPAANQNNIQLNATGGGGLGTSNNAGNKAEQDDLYNRSVNNMLNNK